MSLLKSPIPERKTRFPREIILKTSLVVFIFLVGSKLLNFYKKLLIGHLFGVSWQADAFFAASYLPYCTVIFFEGVIYLGFLPFFSQVKAESEERARHFANEILWFVFFLTGFFALVAWFASPWLVSQMVPGFSKEEFELTCQLFRILGFVIIFSSLTFFFQSLNSFFGRPALAASSAFVDTSVMIVILWLSWKWGGIHAAAWAAVAGALTACMVQGLWVYRWNGLSPTSIRFRFSSVLKITSFLIPFAFIWFFQQIPLVILNRFGSGMWEGTISALTISQTLTTVPIGLVSQTVLLTVFPRLTQQATESRQNPNGVKDTFFQTLKAAFLSLIPLGFLLSAVSRPFVVLFFSGGGISDEGIRRLANALTCFGWATFALYADLFLKQSLLAIRKSKLAIFMAAFRALLTYFFCYFLIAMKWDYQGLALGFSLGLVVNFFFMVPLILRNSQLAGEWKEIFTYSFKLVIASSPLIFLGWFFNGWPVWEWMKFTRVVTFTGIMIGGVGGISLYLLFLHFLKVKELTALLASFKRSQKVWLLADTTN